MGGLELIKALSYIPAIIGLLIVGLFVYINNSADIRNRLFALFSLTTGLWQIFLFLGDTATTNATALWSLRLGLFFGQLIFQLFFQFALEFPFPSNVRRLWTVALHVPNVLLVLALLTPLGVQTVAVQRYGVQPVNLGAAYALSDVVGVLYLLAGIVLLARKYRRADLDQKGQIRLVLIGLGVAILANIFSGVVATFLHVDSNYIWLGSFSLFVFTLLMAYAIVRHKFFDIRPVATRAVAYLLLTVSLSGIYGVIVLGGTNLLFKADTSADTLAVRLVYLAAALAMAFSFQQLRRFFDRLSQRLFYRDAYDPQDFLGGLNSILVGNLDIKSLVTQSTDVIERYIRPSHVSFYLTQTQHNPSYFNASDSRAGLAQALPDLRTLAEKQKYRLIMTDGMLEDKNKHRLHNILRKNGVGVVLCLINTSDHKVEEVGYIFIGYKKSGNPYDAVDKNVLGIVANELVIAFQNALRFEEIQNFNKTLQGKVQHATRELRRTNEKLKTLDETKDEFISMASHQLRTPLTSVKGYLSMVLEGDAGKVSDNQRKLLEQSYASSQRMVYLISDLLNLSRLNTGKFVIEPSPVDLSEVVQAEYEQLAETAKSRDLTLVYDRPATFPRLMLDETKIHQVVMNLIDNAIYYTHAGGTVTVELRETPAAVEYMVHDTGIGVPKAVQHKLFSKFYRAGNAQQARPDGTGLGLFMVKKVVAAQGGSIIFQSEEGKGSTFGFRFNKADHTVPNTPAAAKPASAVAAK